VIIDQFYDICFEKATAPPLAMLGAGLWITFSQKLRGRAS